jgi:ribosome assembly protein RRB1
LGISEFRADLTISWSFMSLSQVWDMAAHVRALSGPSIGAQADTDKHKAPLYIFTGHKDEGFAIDWSPITPGRLVTGKNDLPPR